MQVFGSFLNGYANPHIQLWEDLRKRTFAAIEANEAKKAAFRTADEAIARGKQIRETFLASIGGLPQQGTSLNARIVDTLKRDGYRIEKIIFESLPKAYITSLLYLPDGAVPAPAILFVSGHHLDAKHNIEYQRVCHDLVINGFAVLAIDPVGQGERIAHRDPGTHEMPWGWGTTEHSQHGLQCAFAGRSVARYFLHDMIRALDYLETRPEVDASRLGITGNSGGGKQTTLLCLSGDPRIKAAFPCTYVTSREHNFMAGIPQDAEQIFHTITSSGIDFDDFFLPIAPTPVLVGAVDSDFFSVEGTALAVERLKRTYRLFNAEDKADWALTPGKHLYNRDLRAAGVNWFARHLLGEERDFKSQPDAELSLLSPEKLWCTPQGHVFAAMPDRKTPFHLNAEEPVAREAVAPAALRERVIDVLRIRERLDNQVRMYPRIQNSQDIDGLELQSIFFLSEAEIMVAGGHLRKKDVEPTEAVIFLGPNGTKAIDDHAVRVKDELDAGKAVFVLDVRGVAAVEPNAINSHGTSWPGTYFNTLSWMSYLAYCIDDCFLGMRVFDVMRAVRYLKDDRGYARVSIRAEGLEPALLGYIAAALEADVAEARIDGMVESFEALMKAEFPRRDAHPTILVHGVLHDFDLPDLRALFEGRTLSLTTVSATEPGV